MSLIVKVFLAVNLIRLSLCQTVSEIIANESSLSTLNSYLETTNLSTLLNGTGPFTVFAPTNDSFTAVSSILPGLIDRFNLTNIISYHVVSGNISSADLVAGQFIPTLYDNATVRVGINATYIIDIVARVSFVIQANITGTNGIIHIVDSVLVPGSTADYISNQPALSILSDELTNTGLLPSFNDTNTDVPLTLLAPTNEAFGMMNQDVLTGDFLNVTELLSTHAISGIQLSTDLENNTMIPTLSGKNLSIITDEDGEYFSDGYSYYSDAQVEIADITVVSGVVHVITNVLRFIPDDVIDIISNDNELTQLTSLLNTHNLTGLLQLAGLYTLFAPVDSAFENMSVPLDTLSNDEFRSVLLYHVLGNELMSVNITNGSIETTLNNATVTFTVDDGIIINGIASNAQVTTEDILSSNGVIHKIDTVLLPFGSCAQVISNDDELSIFNAALEVTQMNDTLDNIQVSFTVLAPNDNAFETLLQELAINETELLSNATFLDAVLPYHVIADDKIMSSNLVYGEQLTTLLGNDLIVNIDENGFAFIDDTGVFSNVIEIDIPTINGIIHKLDGVLIPNTTETGITTGSIVNAIYNTVDLSTLKDAVITAQLLAEFTESSITVLAPDNDAFAKIGTINQTLNNATKLRQILQYHVIPEEIHSENLEDGQQLTTLLGDLLTVSIDNGSISFVDVTGFQASIVTSDIQQTNGIIHIIDSVLQLELSSIYEFISTNDDFSQLTDLVHMAGFDEMLNSNGTYTLFAPTNEALNALNASNATIYNDLLNDTTLLTNTLLYHMLDTVQPASTLLDGNFNTLHRTEFLNQFITVVRDGNTVTLTDSYVPQRSNIIVSVTGNDINTVNGVVHVIDNVLLINSMNTTSTLHALGLSELMSLLNETGLDTLLDAPPTTLTLFAPTNEAFQNIPDEIFDRLINNTEELNNTLLYHVVADTVIIGNLEVGSDPAFETLNTDEFNTIQLIINPDNNIQVSSTDANISNIDPIDIQTTTGLIQILDAVLFPGNGTLIDLMRSHNLTALIDVLNSTNLTSLLTSGGPYTVFGPTNEAFTAANNTINDLTPQQLSQVLQFHIIQGELLAENITDGMTVLTLQGGRLQFRVDNDSISIIDGRSNRINITSDNIESVNGYLHIIDGVLLIPLPSPSSDGGLRGWQWALIIIAIVIVLAVVTYIVIVQCNICGSKDPTKQSLLPARRTGYEKMDN